MNKTEKEIIKIWNIHNTTYKDFSNAAFQDLCDIGSQCDPKGTRYCSLDSAFKQIIEHGSKDDIEAALNKLKHYWYHLGEYDCMTNLVSKFNGHNL